MGTKNNPGKFDCYAKAEPDEPMFVLLGRDLAASLVVTFWVAMRLRIGAKVEDETDEARTCARDLEAWARSQGKDVDAALVAFKHILAEGAADATWAAVKAEREACAAICNDYVLVGKRGEPEAEHLRDAILARGKE